MTPSKSKRYWLLALAIVVIAALGGGVYVRRRIQLTAATVHVKIYADCSVDSEPNAGIWDMLIWDPPDVVHQYSVHFPPNKTPFYLSSVTVVPAGKAETVTGDIPCVTSFNSNKCYFTYHVYKDGKTCGDPGVHVGPPKFLSY